MTRMDNDKKYWIKYWIGFTLFIIVIVALGFWIASIFIDHFGYIIVGAIICAILLVGDIFSHIL